MRYRWLVLGAITGFIVGILLTVILNVDAESTAKQAEEVSHGMKQLEEIQSAFSEVADGVGPAVVTISTEKIQEVASVRRSAPPGRSMPGRNFRGEHPLERFFEEFFGTPAPRKQEPRKGLGSGFIFDERGYILTNNHVIEGATKITVMLPDGRSFAGTVTGTDPRNDLAVIHVEGEDLPLARFGDSDAMKTGMWVMALGNPFGNILRSPKPTVTVGVVSALHRHLQPGKDAGVHFDMIQTDAAINPGNSGGPLVNMHGEVIGINTAIIAPSGGFQGIGFAIPSNMARDVVKDLIEGRPVSHSWMGVTAQEITGDLAEYFDLPARKGVLIASVLKGSPADEAGIDEGDIIAEFSGEPIGSPYDLARVVGKAKVGSKHEARILRHGKPRSITVTIGKRPGDDEIDAGPATESREKESVTWRGIQVADITDDIAAQLGLTDRRGIVVVSIDPASPFYPVGIRAGTIIWEINQHPVNSIGEFSKLVKDARGKVLVRTNRGYAIVREGR